MTKAQLLEELAAVRARLAELEARHPPGTDRPAAPTELLQKVATVFLTATNDIDLYERVLGVVLDVTGSKLGLFGHIREDGALVVPTMSAQAWSQCQVPGKPLVFPRKEWGDGLWPRALRSGQQFH
ncbi:MAG: hypothetical protein FJX74_18405, partial [Armatimonadetes bacterium]|nr:hypothetical protein [Armatimonadota bacterium]